MELNKFIKIEFNELVCNSDFVGSVYIKLNNKKYIKVADNIKDLTVDRIASYQKNGANALYLRENEVSDYLCKSAKQNLSRIKTEKMPISEKMQFLSDTSKMIIKHFYNGAINYQLIQSAQINVEAIVKTSFSNDIIYKMLKSLHNVDSYLYIHGLGVSLYSIILAKSLNWSHPINIENIGLGGLLHDIGKRNLPQKNKYITSNNMALSNDIKQYQTHSQIGYDLLKEIMPEQQKVLDIVLQHHENCNGTGFPRELKKMQIYYPARIIKIIDDFCNLIFPPLNQPQLSCKEAINIMQNSKKQLYDKEIFNVFLKTFK